MGLAPYGEPKYAQLIFDHLVDLKPDGTFRLNLEYFNYCTGLTMTNGRFDELFGGAPRKPEARLTQREMDLAASIQAVTEEVVLRLTRSIAEETGLRNLCLAGGVALNCVANGKVLRDAGFEDLWIQPAAGDAGGALGAALVAYHLHKGKPRPELDRSGDLMKGAYLGPSFSQQECEARLRDAGASFTVLSDEAVVDACARDLAEGRAVGWFQGRMEFGPRALGARSILGDARSPTMQSVLNLKVKYRESFRPFAPSVLRERVAEWFELDYDSPYMLLVADVVEKRRLEMTPRPTNSIRYREAQRAALGHPCGDPRRLLGAGTDGPCGHKSALPRADLCVRAMTDCPVIVNTSFNVRGEPIVCTPEDAFRCFMGTEIEVLALGDCYLRKEDQNMTLRKNYEKAFELD